MDGATWLDRELASPNRTPLVQTSFGTEVDSADKGYAWRAQDGTIRAPKHLVARLERGDIERVGKSLAADKPAPFKMKAEGERVSGVYTARTNLVPGKYAIVESAYEFTLVPWRPVMDERLARQISGVVRDSSISWDFTQTRGIGIGM